MTLLDQPRSWYQKKREFTFNLLFKVVLSTSSLQFGCPIICLGKLIFFKNNYTEVDKENVTYNFLKK